MVDHSHILYEDDTLLILNKPAGLPVHPGSGGGENLEIYLSTLSSTPLALAHRLDKDTSGCLILGKTPEALRHLGRLFSQGRITKTYWAIVHGNVTPAEGHIDIPLRKQSPLKHRWWMMPHPDGQPSLTDYKVLGSTPHTTWLELHPRTGRTHQLRVHCQAIGTPIVGDKVYGIEGDNPNRPLMHLHARAMTIPRHSQTPITVTAPPPEHMLERLQACSYNITSDEAYD